SAVTTSTSTVASCIGTIHERRRPKDADQYRSMSGAQTNLNAHGTTRSEERPTSSSEEPLLRSMTGSAWVKKPTGSPCDRWRQPSRPMFRSEGRVSERCKCILGAILSPFTGGPGSPQDRYSTSSNPGNGSSSASGSSSSPGSGANPSSPAGSSTSRLSNGPGG